MSLKCPACGLFSTDGALRCDCGFEFDMKTLDAAQRSYREAHRIAGRKNMLIGALVCLGGITATVIGEIAASASGGGMAVVWWGAIVFGGIQFFRGIQQRWPRD